MSWIVYIEFRKFLDGRMDELMNRQMDGQRDRQEKNLHLKMASAHLIEVYFKGILNQSAMISYVVQTYIGLIITF